MFDSRDSFLIADCHLEGSRPGVTALLLSFLNTIQGAGALWILGALVEYWLGDDAGDPQLDGVFDALNTLNNTGTSLHIMHGNRDFLLGQRFGERIGAQVMSEDELSVQLGSESVLLMHGDTLCTDDTDYQNLRTLLRSSQWQEQFLSLSVPDRIEQAKQLRDKSRDATASKSQSIMDVNDQAVTQAFTRANVNTLIHGHTHRPDTHSLTINNVNRQRLVLGDWHDDHAWVAHVRNGGETAVRLKRFPFTEPLGSN